MGGGEKKEAKREQWQGYTSTTKENNFATDLISKFNQQYADTKEAHSFLTDQLKDMLAQAQTGKGMTPEEEAARRTEAEDTLSSKFSGEQQALREQLKSMGSPDTKSGVTAAGETSLDIAEAAARSKAELGITQENAELARQKQAFALTNLGKEANEQSQLSSMLGREQLGAAGTTGELIGATSGIIKTQGQSKSTFGKIMGGLAGAGEMATGIVTHNPELIGAGTQQMGGGGGFGGL